MFSRTHLLPCRHAFYYRSHSATFESVIPFVHINQRWCRQTELNDIASAQLPLSEHMQTRKATASNSNRPLSPRSKYKQTMVVMEDLANIMQDMGTSTFSEMLDALKCFRNEAVKARVPVVMTRQSTNSTAPQGLQPSEHQENEARDQDQDPDSVRGNFVLAKATKKVGKTKRSSKIDRGRSQRIRETKQLAEAFAHGLPVGAIMLSDLKDLLNQPLSFALANDIVSAGDRCVLWDRLVR
jgi:hypothetical protein